jgi:hypothetical protein
MAEIHDFTVKTYYRLAFSGEAESIFRNHQVEIDKLLRNQVPEVLEKIPPICARLSEGDTEAVSQAQNSCRRMIKAFADAVQPPEEKEIELNGEKYQIGSDKILNRYRFTLAKIVVEKDAANVLIRTCVQFMIEYQLARILTLRPTKQKRYFSKLT